MSKLDDLKQKLNKNKPKKIKFAGLDVAIENFPGSLRKWIGPDGKPRVTVVKNSYGFLTKHIGEDGDELDVYLGSNPNAKEVYAINQNNPKTGMLDEQKVMLGFDSPEEAKAVYLSHYNRPDFYRSTTTIPFDTFKGMLTDAKPGSLKWKKKNKRDLKTQAIFSSDTENFDDPNEHWITVGGKRTEEGKHVGGSHIEIKGDEVEKGPPDLKNKPIDDLKSKMNKDQPNTIQDVGKFLGGMGKAASDGFIDTMWNKVQAGQSIPRMGQLENKLRDLQKTGALKSREDISKVIDEHFNPKQNSPINDLKSKMSSKITPGVPQFGKPKPSSAPAPKIIPNSQYDLKTGKQINSQPTSQNVEAKPITPPIEHPFYDKKTGTTAKTDEQNNETKWWNKPNQASDPNKLNPVQQGQKNIENDKGSQSAMRNSHDLKNFGWGKMAQAGNANADKINELAASKGITANDAQKMLSERGNNSPQLSQQNLPSKNNSGTSGSAPINQIEENPTPSSVNPPQEQLQPNIGAPKGPINDKPTKNSPESSLFYPSGKFFPPSESKAPVNAPQAPQSQQELLSDKPESGVQRITPNDFAKEWDSVEGWAGARDNPEHAENIAKGLNQLGDREHAVMQHSNGKHIIVSRPKQNQPTSNIGQSTQGLGQNQLSQTPPEQIQPNTQIPSEEIQDQLGETGAATPAINSPVNPNEIKQQNNKVASQEPLFDGPKTPAQQPLSEENPESGKPNDYSKASIERQLLDHFQKNGGNTEDQDERLTQAYHSPFTFRRTSKTKSGFPGEIDRALDGPDGKKLRRLLSLTDSPEGSQGEDLMGDLGEQGYIDLLNRKLSGKKNAQIQSAIDFAKKSGDPQMEFLAKLHEITPNRQDKKPIEIVDPKQLQVGEQATIHGIPVEIKEDEDGNKSVNDGGQLPNVPVESMNSLPIDKGSRKISEPEISNEPFAPEEKDNVEAKQEIEQEPENVESGIGESNKEIPEDEQGNISNENVNPTEESPQTNPSDQVGKSERENRVSEPNPKPIPSTEPNKLEGNQNEKEKPKTIPQNPKVTNQSDKTLGKEKQNVSPPNQSKEKINENSENKPTIQSPDTSNPQVKNEVPKKEESKENKPKLGSGKFEEKPPKTPKEYYNDRVASIRKSSPQLGFADSLKHALEQTKQKFPHIKSEKDLNKPLPKAGTTRKRPVTIEKTGNSWHVEYADRNKYQKHSPGGFDSRDSNLEDVKNWVRNHPDIELSPEAEKMVHPEANSKIFAKLHNDIIEGLQKAKPGLNYPEYNQMAMDHLRKKYPNDIETEKDLNKVIPSEKPASPSVETPKSNEIDKNWYGENGVKNLLKDARSGNESAIKEARSRGLAEYRTPQPKPRTYKPKWTSDEPRGTLSPEETEKQFNDIDNELIKFGFTKKESPSGSRYYENKNGQKIRVSDHDPNEATKQWIDREDVEEIRGNKRGAIDRVKDLIGENWSEQPVDISKQLGLYAKDKEGNPAEVGEKTGQSNLFNPNKYKGEEKPNEEKVKPQFDPKHTQEMFPEKKENKSPIDQLKDKMQKNKGSDYRVDENEGYVEVKRNGEVIASGVRQADGKIGDIQYKHPVHQKLNAIRNAVQRAINEHQEKQI